MRGAPRLQLHRPASHELRQVLEEDIGVPPELPHVVAVEVKALLLPDYPEVRECWIFQGRQQGTNAQLVFDADDRPDGHTRLYRRAQLRLAVPGTRGGDQIVRAGI